MPDTSLRRKVGWLIAIRAIIGTLLLGTATFAQITAPGSFQVDPFFFLIGLTYALTISYAAALGLPARSVAEYTYALNAFGFFAVAWLSGSLAESLRSTGVQLAQASSDIADLQALNQHVIDSLPSGLATTDNTQRILTFNRAAEHITGVPFRTAVGRPIMEVLQLPASVMESINSDLKDAGARRHEFRYRPLD